METARPRPWILWLVLLGWLAAAVALTVTQTDANAATGLTWMLALALGAVLALVLLARLSLPGRLGVLTSVGLAALVWAAHLAESLISFNQVLTSLTTLLSCLAVFSTVRRYGNETMRLAHRGRGLAVSIGIGVAVGLALGAVNLFLARSSGRPWDVGFGPNRFLWVLSPAIFEEIACRAVFLAFAIHVVRGRVRGRAALPAWLLMTLPHTYAHVAGMAVAEGVGQALVSFAFLFVLFAVPFTLLQLRRDVLSASVGHGLVDLIRFTALGS